MIDHENFSSEPWAIVESRLGLDMLAQTESVFALANGHLGLRGNLDEGEPRALAGTYLNGFYESHPIAYGERGYGFPEDGQTVVNVTDGKIIRLLVEDEPLDVHRGTLESHERRLDLRTGILTRTLTWTSAAGLTVKVTSHRMVSLRERSVAAIRYEVEAVGRPMRVALQSILVVDQFGGRDHPLSPRQALERGAMAGASRDPRQGADLGAVLESEMHVEHGHRVVLTHRTRSSGLSLAAGMEHVLDCDSPTTLTQSEPDLGRVTVSVQLQPGRPLRMVKLLAYHWSSQQSMGWLRDQVDASLENALAEGFEGLARSQREALDAWWMRADIELDGDPEIQLALRFAQFQVLQASARAETRAIPAKGLTGPGYDGHAFWDTESFVLPALMVTLPKLARDALMWRHSTLELARERAVQLGLRGAALPWRTIHGEECSGYWPAGTAAFHVNADVALAVRRYFQITGDEEFVNACGLELLVETARLWESLGHRDAGGHFRIDGVTGPDEYSALADNNLYTNLMAQSNLRCAAELAERFTDAAGRLEVGGTEIAAWREAAETMRIPFDERLGIHGQDEHFTEHQAWDFAATGADQYPLLLHFPYFQLYRRQVVKQADLVMALFLHRDAFAPEQRRRDFEYYEARTVRDSSLSACVQSIVAADVGHMDLAYDYLAEAALMDLHNLQHNVPDGVHIASLAGAVLAVQAGLGGLRVTDAGFDFRPRLPAGLKRLSFTVAHTGRLLRVQIEQAKASYHVLEGEAPLTISHWGEQIDASSAGVHRPIPPAPELERPRQPPGREPARRNAGRS